MPEPGVRERLVQDNQSFSTLNVLRGLHYQLCHPQGKFVRVVTGRDLRRSGGLTTQFADLWPVARSHVIWREQADVLDSTRTRPWVRVISEGARALYKSTDFYHPKCERTLAWNDPDVNVDWGLEGAPIISAKDALGLPFREAETFE
jgi:dTDP-4-dehydrorhamnose 3,5-epimerase